jgi:3-methyladenine DNA glycosylase AlkD
MTKLNLELLAKDIEYIKKAIQSNSETAKEEFAHLHTKIDMMNKRLDNDYVRMDVFEVMFFPIQKIVYGLVGLVLIAVVGAILSYIVISKP